MIVKYYLCNDCYKMFKLPMATRKYKLHNPNFKFMCPMCQSRNLAIISKKQYNKNI